MMTIGPSSDAPSPAESGPRRLAAISFADVVGYAALMAEDERGTHRRWMSLLDMLRARTDGHRGRIIKSTGDGVLVEFPSALDAVQWAEDAQQAARGAAAREPASPPIALRIAVHIGDVVDAGSDIYGNGVNVAARLQEHAEPGGIIISEAVHDLVGGSLTRPAVDLGLLRLKSFERPVHAFALSDAANGGTSPRAQARAEPSIAVLPLQNLSGNPEDDYLATGIIDDIIVSLASLNELVVIARGSTVSYGSQHRPDPQEAGRALGVRYVMTGTMRRSPRAIRISVQLCDASSGASLWGHSSEVAPTELFEVQDEIVTRIVAGIAPHVRSSELRRAMRKRPDSFTAYDCTLRALDLINSLDRQTFLRAREYLETALATDPDFTMALAWAARWRSLLIGQGWSRDRQADAAEAAALAKRALTLDRHNALALATHAHIRSFLFHDYDTALAYFDRAIAACPNSALAWTLSSATLSYVGQVERAVKHAERALRLSPFDQGLFYYYGFLGIAHYAAGSYQEAVKWCRMSESENPLYTSNKRTLAAALAALGRDGEAAAVVADFLRQEPGFTMAAWERELQPFADAGIKARYVNDLRNAGLPP